MPQTLFIFDNLSPGEFLKSVNNVVYFKLKPRQVFVFGTFKRAVLR